MGDTMSRPLICAREFCDNQCGVFYQATNDDPEDVQAWNESLINESGQCFCSKECMKPEEEE
jgi:hypothetical protein